MQELQWDNEQIEVIEHFKYLGLLKSADGNCSKYTRSRIGMAMKRMLDFAYTDLERQRNKQRSANETSTLAGVDGSHIRRRRLDSEKS